MYNVAHPQHYVISLYNIICNKSELEFKNITRNTIIFRKLCLEKYFDWA